MHRVRVLAGDITRLTIDAVVNAANNTLMGGGGVDGAIHDAAGPELDSFCLKIPELAPGVRCPTGDSRITPGFDLPAKYIVHTVGPIWYGGDKQEPNLLAGCYRSALKLATQHQIKSIAFPAISCGVFGYPIGQACQIAVTTIAEILDTETSIREVILVGFDQVMYNSLTSALDDWRQSNP